MTDNIPSFSKLVVSNSVASIAHIDCVTIIIATVAEALLKILPYNEVLIHLQTLYKRCRNNSNIVDMDTWDPKIARYVGMEFLFFIKFRCVFFNVRTDRGTV